MKISKYNTKEEWLAARVGKITGSSLKDVITLRGTSKKKGFYELIASRLAANANDENPMDRGTRLEPLALEKFTQKEGVTVNTDLVIWTRDNIPDIAISPDGYIEQEDGKIKEAVEIKCLSSASHIEAIITNSVPDEYYYQALQYFIVNDDLESLHFCFYDPRFIESLQFHSIMLRKENLKEDIKKYYLYQVEVLTEVKALVTKLSLK